MNKILNKLYELIPMDKTTRNYFLKQLLDTGDKTLSLLFSIQEHVKYSNNVIDTTPNTVHLKDYQISEILHNITYAKSPKEVNEHLNKLDTKHQIVVKQLITDTKVYSRQVILENINKLYTYTELKYELTKNVPESTPSGVQYVIHNNCPLRYIYRSGSKNYTSVPNSWEFPVVPSSFCYLFDNGTVKVRGYKDLYKYFIGEGILPKSLLTELPTFKSEEELLTIKNSNRGKYITIFYKTAPTTEYIEEGIMEVKPFDWLVDENFNPIGVKFKHDDVVYALRLKVSKRMLSNGLSSFKVLIGYNIRNNNKLTKITFKGVQWESSE